MWNLAGYATGLSNEPEEEEEEEYAAGICEQPSRNTVGGNQGWENENKPTLAPSTLGIHGGMAGRFTKQATTLPEEEYTQNTGTKSRELHRVLLGENPILHNTIGGGKERRGGTGTMAALTEGQQQGAGGGIQYGQQ